MPVIVVRLSLAGSDLELFDAYEAKVLPLLSEHGGTLLRRRRSGTQDREVHVIHFADPAGFDAYLSDPRRVALAPVRAQSGVRSRVRIFD